MLFIGLNHNLKAHIMGIIIFFIQNFPWQIKEGNRHRPPAPTGCPFCPQTNTFRAIFVCYGLPIGKCEEQDQYYRYRKKGKN